jgi:hypothetical protein
MSRVKFDQEGQRVYETGVSDVVLYLKKNVTTGGTPKPYNNGVAWNGVTAINESPSGAEATPLYADNIKYLNLMSNEEFGASVEAFMYPDEFGECDGSAEIAEGVSIGQQKRETFGLCYKSLIGNDEDGIDKGYKLNLIYGALAAPSEKAHSTVNETPEAMTMSWDLSTTPVEITGKKPAACLTIDSTKVNAVKLKTLEDILYGTDPTTEPVSAGTLARLPLPDEIATIFAAG